MSEELQGTQWRQVGSWGKLPGGIPTYIQEFKARHWPHKAQLWADLAHGPPFVTSTGETFVPGRPHQGYGLGVGWDSDPHLAPVSFASDVPTVLCGQ